MERQAILKEKLEHNSITETEFFNELTKLDQSHPNHGECFNNIKILEDESVRTRFMNGNVKSKSRYLLNLSFFHFHAFQYLAAVQNKDIPQAVDHLKKACALRNQHFELNSDEKDLFLPYIKATLCYMENDLPGLLKNLEVLERVDKSHFMYVNIKIIQRLRDDLIEHKSPQYNRKYY